MKSYGNHNPGYDSRILGILPEYVIDNTPHGLYGEMYGYRQPWLLQDVARYQAAGIKVIGYLTAGYEGSGGDDGYTPEWYSLSLNRKLIENMTERDGVDGVFIDECSAFPGEDSKNYLKELTALAHRHGLITWGNTGEDDFDEWFFTGGGFDLVQSSEDWRGQELTDVQRGWGFRISVTGFRARYTASDAFELTVDAWNKGIAYCYINNAGYDSIAPWFEEYAGMLRHYHGGVERTPSAGQPDVAPWLIAGAAGAGILGLLYARKRTTPRARFRV